jgi:FAD:protein FMN transferase
MKDTRIIMGMPITVELVDPHATPLDLEDVFEYFNSVDRRFSVFKDDSEISRFNQGVIREGGLSQDLKTIFSLCEKTKQETEGYFDAWNGKIFNPSGVVKGWAIWNAAGILEKKGFHDFCMEAGGDIQIRGENAQGRPWSVGIRNPFNIHEVVKVVYLEKQGIATSGTYIRGQHIYNPKRRDEPITDIVSLTVIGPDVFEADRFATPAFAMGRKGVEFIEGLEGFEGYMIDKNGVATMTSGFEKYTVNPRLAPKT